MNKWLIGGGLILAIAYLSYQWGVSRTETRYESLAKTASEDFRAKERQWQSKIAQIENKAVEASQEATARAYEDQRSIRQLNRKYQDSIDLCERSRGDEYADYVRELDQLLNRSVCRSRLPSKGLPPVCDGEDLRITHTERVSYTAEVIDRYEQEGLRCNALRAQIQVD